MGATRFMAARTCSMLEFGSRTIGVRRRAGRGGAAASGPAMPAGLAAGFKARLLACFLTALAAPLAATAATHKVPDSDGAAVRALYLDKAGVVRWRDSNEEVALYGANYC